MIYSRKHLREVLEEIAGWSLDRRRQFIADIEKAFDARSAQQLKDGLLAMWRDRK